VVPITGYLAVRNRALEEPGLHQTPWSEQLVSNTDTSCREH